MLTDCHCHLSQLSESDLTALLDRAKAAEVTHLVAIGAGYGVEDNAKTLELTRKYSQISCALGIHPHDAEKVTDAVKADLETLWDDENVRAVGEIGLDYHYMNSPRERQREILSWQIDAALKRNKPIVIHDRDAGNECVEMLQDKKATQGMVHCFTGTRELAQKYLELGFYVSFTGIITFKKAANLCEVVQMVPLEKMLIETDSPFLAPIPYRGKTNEPAYVRYVAEKVAEIKKIDVREVARITTRNAQELFGFN